MNYSTLRNLFAALLALSVTAITTQTIVHDAPRPYLASAAPLVQPAPAMPAPVALCGGRSGTVC